MNANLIAVKTPQTFWRGKGRLGLLQDPVFIHAINGVAYNPHNAAPLLYPLIPQGASTAACKELRVTNEVQTFDWDRHQHTQRIAVNIGAAALEEWVIAELDDPDEGLNGVDICTLYEHMMERFTTISQTEIDANMEMFNEGMYPSKILAVYVQKQEQCLDNSVDAEDPISEATMMATGTKHAVASGDMSLAWRKWVRTLNKTCNLQKIHWTTAFQEKRKLRKLATTHFDGMANAATSANLGRNMITALDNLTNPAVQKNDTVEMLVIANKALTDSLAARDNECARLLSIITALSTGRGANVGGGGGGGGDNDGNGSKTPWDPEG